MSVDLRAVELEAHEKLVAHEAGHGAMAALVGLDIEEISAPYWTLEDAAAGDPDDPAGRVLIRPVDVSRDPDVARAFALMLLAGLICEGEPPPRWPLSESKSATDEAQLGRATAVLDLDRRGYGQLVQDAFALTMRRDFESLHAGLSYLLERHSRVDGATTRRLKAALLEGTHHMEHLELKAATSTLTEAGEFEAVISTESVDRERDVVIAEAMVTALRAWTTTGKLIPLAWQHSTAAEDQIGHIDPETVKAANGEVIAGGWIDRSTERGAHAWRLTKGGTLGFSFGYLILDAFERGDGVREIRALDVFEVSATNVPMNHQTRVLGWKSAASPAADFAYRAVFDEWYAAMAEVLAAEPGGESVEAKAARTAREFASVRPVQIARFGCDAGGP